MSKCYYCDKEAKYKSAIEAYDEVEDRIVYESIDVCEEHKIKDAWQELRMLSGSDELKVELKDELYRINLKSAKYIQIVKNKDKFIVRIYFENFVLKVWYNINLEPIAVQEAYLLP